MEERISCMAIIITKKKKVFVLNNEGEWVFNKGHLENGESFISCAIRESKEEAGIVLDESECLGQVDEFSFYFDKEKAKKIIKVFVFLIDSQRKIFLNKGEGFISYRWLDFAGAIQILTHSDAKSALEKAILLVEENNNKKAKK